MNLNDNLVAGVVGAGVFGSFHAGKYAQLPGVRLGGVYDVDSGRAHRLAKEHGAVPYTDFDELLQNVDVATIASPASTHYELAARALERDVHVLVEKPIALRLEEADRLIALSEKRGLTVQVGHQERFIIESLGLIARTRKPRSIWCRRLNPPTGRGEDVSVAFDLMIHDLDLVRSFDLGSATTINAMGAADDIEAEIAFGGGVVASFQASRRATSRDRRMGVVYDDGLVEIDFVNRTIANTTGLPVRDFGAEEPAFADPLGYGVAQFLAAIRGEREPAITAIDGRAALEWAIDIERAANDGGVAKMRARA
jgi:predicted dehydrogenase